MSESHCREPDDLDEQLSEHNSDDYMKYIVPPQVRVWMNKQDDQTNHPSATFAERGDLRPSSPEQVIYGNKTCPHKLPSSADAALSDRAVCPFYYVMTYDPMRHPTAIAEAKCKCSGCIGGDITKICEQFYQPIKVLRKIRCEAGMYVYEPEILQIVAGCMCAERRTSVAPLVDTSGTTDDARDKGKTTPKTDKANEPVPDFY